MNYGDQQRFLAMQKVNGFLPQTERNTHIYQSPRTSRPSPRNYIQPPMRSHMPRDQFTMNQYTFFPRRENVIIQRTQHSDPYYIPTHRPGPLPSSASCPPVGPSPPMNPVVNPGPSVSCHEDRRKSYKPDGSGKPPIPPSFSRLDDEEAKNRFNVQTVRNYAKSLVKKLVKKEPPQLSELLPQPPPQLLQLQSSDASVRRLSRRSTVSDKPYPSYQTKEPRRTGESRVIVVRGKSQVMDVANKVPETKGKGRKATKELVESLITQNLNTLEQLKTEFNVDKIEINETNEDFGKLAVYYETSLSLLKKCLSNKPDLLKEKPAPGSVPDKTRPKSRTEEVDEEMTLSRSVSEEAVKPNSADTINNIFHWPGASDFSMQTTAGKEAKGSGSIPGLCIIRNLLSQSDEESQDETDCGTTQGDEKNTNLEKEKESPSQNQEDPVSDDSGKRAEDTETREEEIGRVEEVALDRELLEKWQKEAQRYVVQGDVKKLRTLFEENEITPDVWKQWRNSCNRSLLQLALERGRPLVKMFLEMQCAEVVELEHTVFKKGDSIWVALSNSIQPYQATVLDVIRGKKSNDEKGHSEDENSPCDKHSSREDNLLVRYWSGQKDTPNDWIRSSCCTLQLRLLRKR